MHTGQKRSVAVVLMGGLRPIRRLDDAPPGAHVADVGGRLFCPPDDLDAPGAGDRLRAMAGYWEVFRRMSAEERAATGDSRLPATTACYQFRVPDLTLPNHHLFRHVDISPPSHTTTVVVTHGGRP